MIAIKCPRPSLGPLNGKQAITIGGRQSTPIHFPLPEIHPLSHVYVLIQVSLRLGGYVGVFLEVTRQEDFRKHPFIAVKAS